MALTDINFQEAEGQDFNLEIPLALYSGVLNDFLVETASTQYPVLEPTLVNEGSNIFIMSE